MRTDAAGTFQVTYLGTMQIPLLSGSEGSPMSRVARGPHQPPPLDGCGSEPPADCPDAISFEPVSPGVPLLCPLSSPLTNTTILADTRAISEESRKPQASQRGSCCFLCLLCTDLHLCSSAPREKHPLCVCGPEEVPSNAPHRPLVRGSDTSTAHGHFPPSASDSQSHQRHWTPRDQREATSGLRLELWGQTVSLQAGGRWEKPTASGPTCTARALGQHHATGWRTAHPPL